MDKNLLQCVCGQQSRKEEKGCSQAAPPWEAAENRDLEENQGKIQVDDTIHERSKSANKRYV